MGGRRWQLWWSNPHARCDLIYLPKDGISMSIEISFPPLPCVLTPRDPYILVILRPQTESLGFFEGSGC